MAGGSLDIFLVCLAVDLDDSNFLASCLTLLAGNFSRSMLESLMGLETNSSYPRKNQNMSLCNILAVSSGYIAQIDLCLNSIVPFINTHITLPEAY